MLIKSSQRPFGRGEESTRDIGNRDREGRADRITKKVQPLLPHFLLRALQTQRKTRLRKTCVTQPLHSCTWAQEPPDRPHPPLDSGIQSPTPSSLRPQGPESQLLLPSGPGVGFLQPLPPPYHGNQAPCPPFPPPYRIQFLFKSGLCLTSSCVRQG